MTASGIAGMHPDNLSGASIDGESNLLFVAFVAYKGPSLVTFHRQALFFLRADSRLTFDLLIFGIDLLLSLDF